MPSQRYWTLARSLAALALAVGLLAAPPQPAQAGGTVGTGSAGSCDEGAFEAALAGGGSVIFDCGAAPHTLILTSMKLIAANTTIDGGGKISLSGGNRVRLLKVLSGFTLILKNITLTNGGGYDSTAPASLYDAGGALSIQLSAGAGLDNVIVQNSQTPLNRGGGGIYNRGSLTLTNSILRGNLAGSGGGVYVEAGGTAVVSQTQFSDNTADGAFAGGLFNAGSASVVGGTFTHNHAIVHTCNPAYADSCGGGALVNDTGAQASVRQSTFVSNTSTLQGGAVVNYGAFVMDDVLLSLNTAYKFGGALYNITGTLVLTRAVVSFNSTPYGGGGIATRSGAITVTESTLNGNSGGGAGGLAMTGGQAAFTRVSLIGNRAVIGNGGGIFLQGGVLRMTHVTLSGNAAIDDAGALGVVGGMAYLTFVTVSGNTATFDGAGIRNYGNPVYLQNVVLADNRSSGTSENCAGAQYTTAAFSLSSDTTCFANAGNNKAGVPASLYPLSNNGGLTQTHRPRPDSPAIDAGVCVFGLDQDQRGQPRAAGATCDMGAVEVQAAELFWRIFLPALLR